MIVGLNILFRGEKQCTNFVICTYCSGLVQATAQRRTSRIFSLVEPVKLATLDQVIALSVRWTPPADFVGTRCAEEPHQRSNK